MLKIISKVGYERLPFSSLLIYVVDTLDNFESLLIEILLRERWFLVFPRISKYHLFNSNYNFLSLYIQTKIIY